MLTLFKKLARDEHGVILSTELVVVGSVLTIGLVTGLSALRQAVEGEMNDLGGAISSLDQSFSCAAHRKSGRGGQCCAFTAGSAFVDCEQQDEYEVVATIDTSCQTDISSPVICEPRVLVNPVPHCCPTLAPTVVPGCCDQLPRHQSPGCSGCGMTSGCGMARGCGPVGGCVSASGGSGNMMGSEMSIGSGVPNFRATEWNYPQSVPPAPSSELLIQPIPDTTTFCCGWNTFSVPAGDLIIPDYVW